MDSIKPYLPGDMQIRLCGHIGTLANTPLLAHKAGAACQATGPAPCSEVSIPYVDASCEKVLDRNKKTVTVEGQIEFCEPLSNLATIDICNSLSFSEEG